MIIKRLHLVTLLFLAMLSCTASQKSSTSSSTENIDLVVTFFSKGAGIDRNTYAEFTNFLTDQHPDLDYSESTHGREGETDFCFDLSSFKKDDKNKFLTEAKAILSKSEIVRIQENSPCIDKKK